MNHLKINKARTKYTGTAALIGIDGIEFIIVAPTTGDIQRALSSIAISINLDTRKCKEVTVTEAETE